MDAPMLKRRLNPFLLVSTVLILSLLAGLTVLYQGTLEDVNSDRQELKDRLNESKYTIQQLETEKNNLSTQIREKESEIQRLKSLLNSKRQEVQKLSQRITTLKNQLEQASSTSNTTESINDTLGYICIDEKTTLSDSAKTLCGSEGHATS